jgi:hypothetical protein
MGLLPDTGYFSFTESPDYLDFAKTIYDEEYKKRYKNLICVKGADKVSGMS